MKASKLKHILSTKLSVQYDIDATGIIITLNFVNFKDFKLFELLDREIRLIEDDELVVPIYQGGSAMLFSEKFQSEDLDSIPKISKLFCLN